MHSPLCWWSNMCVHDTSSSSQASIQIIMIDIRYPSLTFKDILYVYTRYRWTDVQLGYHVTQGHYFLVYDIVRPSLKNIWCRTCSTYYNLYCKKDHDIKYIVYNHIVCTSVNFQNVPGVWYSMSTWTYRMFHAISWSYSTMYSAKTFPLCCGTRTCRGQLKEPKYFSKNLFKLSQNLASGFMVQFVSSLHAFCDWIGQF